MRTHYLALLVIAVIACQSPKKEPGIHKISFGSCSRQDMEKQMWSEIIPDSADLWIWAGDNIYGDTEDMELMKSKYDKQKNRESYRQFTGSVKHLIGIWDDHDYGLNDGGKEYPKRDESKKLMLDFLDADPDDPRWKRNGAYGSYEFGPEGQKVKVILLDTRYFRDPLKKDTVNGRRINVPAPGTILFEP